MPVGEAGRPLLARQGTLEHCGASEDGNGSGPARAVAEAGRAAVDQPALRVSRWPASKPAAEQPVFRRLLIDVIDLLPIFRLVTFWTAAARNALQPLQPSRFAQPSQPVFLTQLRTPRAPRVLELECCGHRMQHLDFQRVLVRHI